MVFGKAIKKESTHIYRPPMGVDRPSRKMVGVIALNCVIGCVMTVWYVKNANSKRKWGVQKVVFVNACVITLGNKADLHRDNCMGHVAIWL